MDSTLATIRTFHGVNSFLNVKTMLTDSMNLIRLITTWVLSLSVLFFSLFQSVQLIERSDCFFDSENNLYQSNHIQRTLNLKLWNKQKPHHSKIFLPHLSQMNKSSHPPLLRILSWTNLLNWNSKFSNKDPLISYIPSVSSSKMKSHSSQLYWTDSSLLESLGCFVNLKRSLNSHSLPLKSHKHSTDWFLPFCIFPLLISSFSIPHSKKQQQQQHSQHQQP
jgi:hypothetical protein